MLCVCDITSVFHKVSGMTDWPKLSTLIIIFIADVFYMLTMYLLIELHQWKGIAWTRNSRKVRFDCSFISVNEEAYIDF